VSVIDDIKASPGGYDFLRLMREFERSSPHKPKIGDSTTVAEEVVALAQDPYVDFPDTNVSDLDETIRGVPRLHVRFLSYFGPQGALPLTTTYEALEWFNKRDPSFVRFTNVFANRFLQLFYRAWAESHPISAHDRPNDDRFSAYIGSFSGIGSEPFMKRDDVPDIAKVPYSGLVASAVKSARRLTQMLRGIMKLDITISERVGSWLLFEPSDLMAVGAKGSSLGVDTFLGKMSYSIGDKFRVHVKTTSLEEYMSLLPSGTRANKLADLVFYHVGHRFEYDVELALPARLAPPTRLGSSGQLGWTAWMSPKPVADDDETYLNDARFDLVERRKVAAAERQRHRTKARAR
jgi:type VI secretion system protein ImpH